MSAAHALLAPLRGSITRVFAKAERSGIDFDQPPGDPGLFGPQSVTWTVHEDFAGMMAGGLCALMLQALHPRALAGVWDHSSFRTDLIGRLRRTTEYVAGTTYAGTDEAERLIAHVARIHSRVRGRLPDGRRYSASEPALLTWVHATEMWSFLAGYRRFADPRMAAQAQDRYFDETRTLALRLGAVRVPASAQAVERYFQRVRPQLAYTERSAEVLDVLWTMRLPLPGGGLARDLFLHAARSLMPDWALALLPLSRLDRLRDQAAALTLDGLAPPLRLALRGGVAARARRRVQALPKGDAFSTVRVAP